MDKRDAKMSAILCVPFLEGGPGFALPLFTDPSKPNQLFVQEVDEYGPIATILKDRQHIDLSPGKVWADAPSLVAIVVFPPELSVRSFRSLFFSQAASRSRKFVKPHSVKHPTPERGYVGQGFGERFTISVLPMPVEPNGHGSSLLIA